ncbi:MAG: hypothetical protein K2H74_03560 [Paramuribaculum sp.]|nr:hypothetical protein [Paramuribaculum sp.]
MAAFQEGDYEGAFSEATASTAFSPEERRQFVGQCRALIAEQYKFLIADAISQSDYAKASSLRLQYREKYGANPMIDEISIPSSPSKTIPSSGTSSGKSGALILIGIIVAFVLIAVIIAVSTSHDKDDEVSILEEDLVESSEYYSDYDNSYSATHVVTDEDTGRERFQEKLRELSGIADIPVIYSDGERYIWRIYTTPYGKYEKSLMVYDTKTDREETININKTDFPDDEMEISAITENDGAISIIMMEYRNSNGWIEGTHVWTINCSTRRWRCVAEAVAGAEFVNGGRAVEISEAEILNPDEPTAFQEYDITKYTVNL